MAAAHLPAAIALLRRTGNGRVAHHTCRPRTLHAASDDAWSVLESHILG